MAVALHSENIEIQEEDDDDEEEEEDDIIYANVETKITAQQKHPRKKRSVRRRYRMLGLGLGLLCGVQALLNIGLRLSLYAELIKENNNLVKDLDHLQSSFDHLQSRHINVTEQKDQIQSRYNKLIGRNDIKRILFCEPHGFTFGGGLCYYISTWMTTTWEKSRQYCRDRQSDLMVINSKEKQDFVITVVPRNQWAWLGLTDKEEEGVWKWVDGTPLTTPKYWHSGEPDNLRDEDCVVLQGGRWSDIPCSAQHFLICERVF